MNLELSALNGKCCGFTMEPLKNLIGSGGYGLKFRDQNLEYDLKD